MMMMMNYERWLEESWDIRVSYGAIAYFSNLESFWHGSLVWETNKWTQLRLHQWHRTCAKKPLRNVSVTVSNVNYNLNWTVIVGVIYLLNVRLHFSSLFMITQQAQYHIYFQRTQTYTLRKSITRVDLGFNWCGWSHSVVCQSVCHTALS